MQYEPNEKEEKIPAEKTVIGNVYRLTNKTGSDDLLRIFVQNSILQKYFNDDIPFLLLTTDNGGLPQGSFVTIKPETELIPLGEAKISLKYAI